MKKIISIFAITVGVTYMAQAQFETQDPAKEHSYKEQNVRLSPGVDEPVFEGAQLESNTKLADKSYKNQFPEARKKNKDSDDKFFLPGNSKTNDTGFYAAGYSKTSFQPTRRKASAPATAPIQLTTSPGTAQD